MIRTARSGALGAIFLGLALLPTPALCLPILSEVFYDATGSDDGKSFVELIGAPGTNLDGFVIEGVNGANGAVTVSVVLGGVIPPDGLFVVADTLADGTSAVVGADLLANFDFQNGPDSIVLRNAAGVVDAVGYGVFGPSDFFAGEGEPAPDAPAGSSLARLFADVDSDDNAGDWRVLDRPTPGEAVRSEVPEPSAAVLLTGGLVLLAQRARRLSVWARRGQSPHHPASFGSASLRAPCGRLRPLRRSAAWRRLLFLWSRVGQSPSR
jgi:hypothetical protein